MSKIIKEHQYEEGLQESKRWLEKKYVGISSFTEWKNFNLNDIHISKNGKGSCFYQKPNERVKSKGKRIRIGLRGCDLFSTYLRKLPYLSPIGGIPIPRYLGYRHSLIHELTHFIQFLQKRTFSEVETTKNELEYLIETEPFYEHQLITYEEKKRQELEYKQYRGVK